MTRYRPIAAPQAEIATTWVKAPESAVASPINAATQRISALKARELDKAPHEESPLPASFEPASAAPITREIVSESSLKNAPRSGRREQASGEPDAVTGNELLALARSWDLWGGAAFVLFVVWMAVSSVFSLQ